MAETREITFRAGVVKVGTGRPDIDLELRRPEGRRRAPGDPSTQKTSARVPTHRSADPIVERSEVFEGSEPAPVTATDRGDELLARANGMTLLAYRAWLAEEAADEAEPDMRCAR